MKLIVGLGNPGDDYELTPHNLGFRVIDRIANEYGVKVGNRQSFAKTARLMIGPETVLLAKPETFMNLSGNSVGELVRKHHVRPEDLIVIQDDLDFPLGTLRIQRGRSSAGHKGIESLIRALRTKDFLRVRIGVAPEQRVKDGAAYVLARLSRDQEAVVGKVLDRAVEAVKVILTEGPGAAMNRFNRKSETEED